MPHQQHLLLAAAQRVDEAAHILHQDIDAVLLPPAGALRLAIASAAPA